MALNSLLKLTSYNYIFTSANKRHEHYNKGLLVALNSRDRICGIWSRINSRDRWQKVYTSNPLIYNPVIFLNYVQISNGAEPNQYLFPLPSAKVRLLKRGDQFVSVESFIGTSK